MVGKTRAGYMVLRSAPLYRQTLGCTGTQTHRKSGTNHHGFRAGSNDVVASGTLWGDFVVVALDAEGIALRVLGILLLTQVLITRPATEVIRMPGLVFSLGVRRVEDQLHHSHIIRYPYID